MGEEGLHPPVNECIKEMPGFFQLHFLQTSQIVSLNFFPVTIIHIQVTTIVF